MRGRVGAERGRSGCCRRHGRSRLCAGWRQPRDAARQSCLAAAAGNEQQKPRDKIRKAARRATQFIIRGGLGSRRFQHAHRGGVATLVHSTHSTTAVALSDVPAASAVRPPRSRHPSAEVVAKARSQRWLRRAYRARHPCRSASARRACRSSSLNGRRRRRLPSQCHWSARDASDDPRALRPRRPRASRSPTCRLRSSAAARPSRKT